LSAGQFCSINNSGALDHGLADADKAISDFQSGSTDEESMYSDDGVLFAALSSKKLSKAEVAILETIHIYVDAWMLNKEDVFIRSVTAGSCSCVLFCRLSNPCPTGFQLAVHGEFIVTSTGVKDSWDLRSRAFASLQDPRRECVYSLSSLCILSSSRAVASLFVFSSDKQSVDSSPLEEYEVTFVLEQVVNTQKYSLSGAFFERVDVVSVSCDDDQGVRPSVTLVAPSSGTSESDQSQDCWGLVEANQTASPISNENWYSSAQYGICCKKISGTGLIKDLRVADVEYFAGVSQASSIHDDRSNTNSFLADVTGDAANVPSSSQNQQNQVCVGGLDSWLREASCECVSALQTLLKWTDTLSLDREQDSTAEIVKYAEYILVPDCMRKLTKAELDASSVSALEDENGTDRGSNGSTSCSVTTSFSTITSRSSANTQSNGRISVATYRQSDLVNVSVLLPTVAGLQSVTLNFAVPMNNTVGPVDYQRVRVCF
jgi:hypothetical protein